MGTRRNLLVLAAVIVIASLAPGLLGCQQRKMPAAAVDGEALAARLVNESARIQQGDLVLVSGGVRDIALLESIAVHVRKAGAFPLVRLQSDRLTRRLLTDVPPAFDVQTPRFELELAELIDAWISVDHEEDPAVLADVPVARIAARDTAYGPVDATLIRRNVRQVNLGNAMYPTPFLAEQFGMPQAELAEIFWQGIDVDYRELQTRAAALRRILLAGREIRITNPNGTDLWARIAGRPIYVSDGAISGEDLTAGGVACLVWLPAGEVALAPEPGTAEGRVVVDRHFFQGQMIQDLTLTFSAGRLESMTAQKGLEPLQARYEAAGPGKELFAYIDIGINPNVHIPPGSRMVAWMPAGMITVGLGRNIWAGGENDTPYYLASYLPGSTLIVDGQVLVQDGRLVD